MADFKTHITVSTGLGIAYGVIGYTQFELPLGSCVIAAGLCGLSGMLPDLDSDSGIPVRETLAFTSAVVPMFLMERFERMGMSHASMVLAGGGMYFFIRFVAWEIFKRFTKHRGMWHSIPAAMIAAMIAFLICSSTDVSIRLYRSWAVFIGFMSHLLMDEIYSVDLNGRLVKKSFGTAMKFFGNGRWANMIAYGLLFFFGLVLVNDPMVQESMEQKQIALPGFAQQTIELFQVKSVKEWLPHDHRTHEEFDQKTLLPIRKGPSTHRQRKNREPTTVAKWLNYITGSTESDVMPASYATSETTTEANATGKSNLPQNLMDNSLPAIGSATEQPADFNQSSSFSTPTPPGPFSQPRQSFPIQ